MSLSILLAVISVVIVLVIAGLILFEGRVKKQAHERREASDLDEANRSDQDRLIIQKSTETHRMLHVCLAAIDTEWHEGDSGAECALSQGLAISRTIVVSGWSVPTPAATKQP